jgi:AraC-like DNA-binding protein
MTSPKKPHLLKIIPPFDSSFILKGDAIPWDNPWHYHPELELIFCISGKGTNFIGNDIRSIEEGEILLLGSNLPHTRQRDKSFYENNSEETPESIIVQFNHDFLGADFFKIPEFEHIDALCKNALRGLKFTGETLTKISGKLLLMSTLNKTQKILELLSILDILAKSEEYEHMNSISYVSDVHEKNSQKINQVYEFTITNFRKPIELAEIAALTNLSISAFCRYFKTRTRKSYFQYLSEVRIGYACRLLSEADLDIGQVAYQSGFNNLSNFNKQFKAIMKTTPRGYLSKMGEK